MENPLLLARLIGPFIIVIGLGLILNVRLYGRIAEDFFKSPALVYVIGLFTFVAGLALVNAHNIWEADWTLIITIFGWITLLKGAWLVLWPHSVVRMAGFYARNMKYAVIPWIIMLLFGIFLTIKGYGNALG
ncbi:MAG: hypothetical protein WC732_01325 [Candidatus Omnitrophota bacterium]